METADYCSNLAFGSTRRAMYSYTGAGSQWTTRIRPNCLACVSIKQGVYAAVLFEVCLCCGQRGQHKNE